MDKLKIEIDVLSGWWFKFEQGDKKFGTLPDNVGDPINDLLTAVRLLYKSFSETECRFFQGPGEEILVLKRDKNIVRGTIYSVSNARRGLNKDEAKVLFEFEDDLFHFTNQIINAYYRLNKQHNMQVDYKELVDLMREEKKNTGI